MFSYRLLLVSFLLQLGLFAQSQTAITLDSIRSLITLSDEYLYNDPARSMEYAHSAAKHVVGITDRNLVNTAYQNYSVALRMSSQYDSAAHYQELALSGWVDLQDSLQIAGALNNLGIIYDERGYNDKAIELYLQAVDIYESQGDKAGSAKVYNNLGIIHKKEGNYEKVRDYYRQSLAIYSEMEHALGTAITMGNLGSVFLELKDFDSAIYFSERSIDLYQANGIDQFIPYSMENMGIAYRNLANMDSAVAYHHRALSLYQKYGNQKEAAFTTNSLAEIALEQAEYQKAYQLALQSQQLAEATGVMDEQIRAIKTISDVQELRGNFEEALKHLRHLIVLNDSVNSMEKVRILEELQTRYESSKKDQEIQLLRAETELNDLQYRNARNTLIGTVAFGAMLLISGYLFFNRYKYKQQSLLSDQKKRNQTLRFKEVVEAEEKERERVARELHDGLGQLLSTAKMLVGGYDDPVIKKGVAVIDKAVEEVRTISHNLMPSALMNIGLIATIRQIARLVNESGNLVEVKLNLPADEPNLSAQQRTGLYRIIQEVVNNAIKYAEANSIIIEMSYSVDDLNLKIEDDGKGFDTQQIDHSSGIGWKNMYTRVEILNGKIDISSEIGRGTAVTIVIPLIK